MRGFWILPGAGLLACIGLPASAADWGALSANVDITSDYRLRGLRGNDHRPALQGGVDWNNDNGWHASLWSSMIDFEDHQNTRVEVDVSAGKKVVLRGTIVDFTVTYYSYPVRNKPANAAPYSYAEAAPRRAIAGAILR